MDEFLVVLLCILQILATCQPNYLTDEWKCSIPIWTVAKGINARLERAQFKRVSFCLVKWRHENKFCTINPKKKGRSKKGKLKKKTEEKKGQENRQKGNKHQKIGEGRFPSSWINLICGPGATSMAAGQMTYLPSPCHPGPPTTFEEVNRVRSTRMT